MACAGCERRRRLMKKKWREAKDKAAKEVADVRKRFKAKHKDLK